MTKELVSMLEDPVCGLDLMVRDRMPRTTHDGETYFFCSDGCRRSFEQEPARWVGNDIR